MQKRSIGGRKTLKKIFSENSLSHLASVRYVRLVHLLDGVELYQNQFISHDGSSNLKSDTTITRNRNGGVLNIFHNHDLKLI